MAIRAAATHDRELLYADERAARAELGYPPYTRLANILLWGPDLKAVTSEAIKLANKIEQLLKACGAGSAAGEMLSACGAGSAPAIQLLGPSPCVLAKRQGNHRWHILLKAPATGDLPGLLAPILKERKPTPHVTVAVDIDPYDLL